MKATLQFIVLPLLVLAAIGVSIKFAWDYSPTLVLTVLGALVLIGLIRGFLIRRADLERGWRVGHQGRDSMFYEEMIDGRWERIPIDGEMLCGDAHHVIYFPSESEWNAMPDWTRGRRSEIVARIKTIFTQPGYEYQEAEPGVDLNT